MSNKSRNAKKNAKKRENKKTKVAAPVSHDIVVGEDDELNGSDQAYVDIEYVAEELGGGEGFEEIMKKFKERESRIEVIERGKR